VPELRPFRGLRYDPSVIGDVGAVLCPPYDVISVAEREQLLARHERNAVRLELPIPPDGVSPGRPGAYAEAARTLDRWVADGTLRRDSDPLVYVYEQRYAVDGGPGHVARSLFCALRLEDYGPAAGVRPHEHTLSGPKEDRFRLLSAVRTNLSPVLLLFDDGAGGAESAGLQDEITASPPALDTTGPAAIGQRLWPVDPAKSAAAARLLELAGSAPLTIADGHHRYETALRYRDAAGAPDESAYVLALLYDAHSGGLSLLPWHRLVSGVRDVEHVFRSAADLYVTERVTSSDDLLARLSLVATGVVGVWTRAGGALLTIDRENVVHLVPGAESATVRWLDANVLSVTLKRMIGSGADELSAQGRLTYVSKATEAIAAVEAGRADVCFLLRPTPVESVLAVAAEGTFMPPKSTLFHPKAATGLVFHSLAP
jgi:uncharacterized protein (DUF1015 family)